VKRLIVVALERACGFVDHLPFGIGWRSGLGCPDGLARWSDILDQKWNTGVWKEPNDPSPG